jgi:hypothetical protein
MTDNKIRARLEYLRGELHAERISMSELAELQGLAEHIEPGDVELLEAAGVPEFPMSERWVKIEMTETYYLEITTRDDLSEAGTDAVIALDELDEDDTASAYDSRTFRIIDEETGKELSVDESQV